MPKIIVTAGQSLLDVAVKYYGSVEGVFDIVRRNKLNGVTDNIYAGELIEVANAPLNSRVARFLESHQVATMEERLRPKGIGWMQITKPLRPSARNFFCVAETPPPTVDEFEVSDIGAPSGITYANGHFWVLDGSSSDLQVFAYTRTGARTDTMFSVEGEVGSSGVHRGISFFNDHLFILTHHYLRAYSTAGDRRTDLDYKS